MSAEDPHGGKAMSRDALRDTLIEELLQRARAGDQAALEELFNRARPVLKEWATKKMRRLRHRTAGSSDIVQETAQRAFEHFSDFQGNTEDAWKSWLWTILSNYVKELNRAASRQKEDEALTIPLDSPGVKNVPAPQTSPSQAAIRREEQARLMAYLSTLPADQHRAIWFCYFKKYPDSKAAKLMGKSPAAIRGLIRRGIDKLRTLMNGGAAVSVGDSHEELGQKGDVSAALMSYIRQIAENKDINRDAFLVEHAAYAGELRPLLDTLDRIQAIWNDPPDSE